MNRIDWIEVSGWLSMCSLYVGLGVGFTVDGMAWAALVGTLPAWAFLGSTRFARKGPQA